MLASWPVPVTICLGCSILRPRRPSSGPPHPAPVRPCEATITPRKYRYILAQAMSGNLRPSCPASAGPTSGEFHLFAHAVHVREQDLRKGGSLTALCCSIDVHDQKSRPWLRWRWNRMLCKCNQALLYRCRPYMQVHREKGVRDRRIIRGDTRRDATSAEYALSPNSFLSISRSQSRCIDVAGFQIKCLTSLPGWHSFEQNMAKECQWPYVSQIWLFLGNGRHFLRPHDDVIFMEHAVSSRPHSTWTTIVLTAPNREASAGVALPSTSLFRVSGEGRTISEALRLKI